MALTQTEIRKLFNKARRILKHPGFDLLIAPTIESPSQLIVITPGRIGNAVQRNKIRRRIKAIVHEEKLNKRGLDLIAIIKKEGVSLTYDQLKALILSTVKPPHS